MHVLMVAAENDALPGGKVGGIGDVIRELPAALSELGCSVTVITPAYGRLEDLHAPQRLAQLDVTFRGAHTSVDLFEAGAKNPLPKVRHVVLDHEAFSPCGRGVIYCNDPADRPFATDASKFALFSAAVGRAVSQGCLGEVDVLHLHDWHTAMLLLLRRCDPAFRKLRKIRCVYTLHNLALQGVRPLRGDMSSLESWFPALRYQRALVADKRWPDCINLMAVGIRMADAVHTVSPSYCKEILRPSEVSGAGYYGGEGLEDDLVAAQAEGRLHGLLNGCEYPPTLPKAPGWRDLLALMRTENLRWAGAKAQVSGANFVAHARLGELGTQSPGLLVTSVGRITSQKVRLLMEPSSDGRAGLEGMLDTVGDNGLLVMLGSGDAEYERFLATTSARRRNLLFLCGYSDALAQALYAAGDLFLMPSSFEPCGISQMLAMRAGQPCLVHQVGGLKDTVKPGVNGFGFNGKSLAGQVDGMNAALQDALRLREKHPQRWQSLGTAASRARFRWRATAEACLKSLYQTG